MLSIGINLVTTDFNRKELLVYHVCDDVTGKVLPVCGADIELSDDGDASSLIEEIKRGVVPLFPDPLFDEAARRMCRRCQKVCLSPESEERKSQKRLARRRRKDANAKLVESYRQ
jgi:hypothetical protein